MLGQFFGFEGRIGRGTWWMGYLLVVLLLVFAFGLLGLVGRPANGVGMTAAAALLSMACSLTGLVISVSTTVKRYHDRNKSGWWWWMGMIPLLGLWQFIECGFCSGEDGDNDYGPPPGSVARRASLEAEIGSLASSRLSKIDDNYLANYARDAAMKQAKQQAAAAAGFVPVTQGKPVFGKR